MSRLSVYWPEECGSTSTAVADAPLILPFRGRTARQSTPTLDVISRARVMFENRQCHHCGYPVVEPLELDDAQVNRSGLEIPGSATLVGFSCCSCGIEWYI
jgi:hypothetical protein